MTVSGSSFTMVGGAFMPAEQEMNNQLWRRYKTIFESKMVGILSTDMNGQILDANDYFLEMVGYGRDDLKAGKLNWKTLTHPKYLAQSQHVAELLRTTGSVPVFEKEYIHKDGHLVPVRLGLTMFEDGTVITLVQDVTQQKDSERKLEEAKAQLEERVAERTRQLVESESFLAAIFENMPTMVFVKDAQDLRFVRFNKAGEDLIGIPRAQLIGKNDYDFFSKEQADFFTSKDRDVLKESRVVDIPEEEINTTRGVRYLHTRKIPVFDKEGRAQYLLGVSEDITELKMAEKQRAVLVKEQIARSAAEQRAQHMGFLSDLTFAMTQSFDLENILKAFTEKSIPTLADICIVDLMDEEGTEISHTQVAAKEREDTEFIQRWRERFPMRWDAPYGAAEVMRSRKTEIINDVNLDQFLKAAFGPEAAMTERPIHAEAFMTVPILLRDEKPLGAISLISTSATRHFSAIDQSMAEEIGRRLAVLIENSRLYYRAQEASRAKTAFLANVSHEIRTPLGAMLGFAEILKEDESLREEQKEAVETVLRNGQQLLHIVDEILDISKVESERIQIESIVFDLPDLLRDVIHLLRGRAEEKGIELRLRLGDLPKKIKSDPTRLRQILINVIGNAIKFTDTGYVEMEARSRNGKRRDGRQRIEFLVTDTGIGISAEQRNNLFQPFSQADSSTTRRFGGTGLGLFLSRKLARLLGGDVILNTSSAGIGSSFLISILGKEVTGIQGTDHRKKSEDAVVVSAKQVESILVVDDAVDNRELFRRFIVRAGVPENRIETAENGAEAVRKALDKPYSLILMDIQMPEMDGFQALKKLRTQGYRGPIVALTAHAMKGDREKCLAAGFDGYLQKPLDRTELKRVLSLDFPKPKSPEAEL
ncbi:two-component hybrid sensor and regulator [Bdellovibrio bacteriovorus str. Tiberius]|uniref:histidine kinase n=2 Tax=Bdellovibrio bacteriovorus TaxID=959 RepID=K7Z968_BDEBC|nr:two-component hybrid sensor and regulator [Bdellovibrio bacteriovorus str. Tiberius]